MGLFRKRNTDLNYRTYLNNLDSVLTTCRRYQDANDYDSCERLFNQARDYYDKIVDLISYEDIVAYIGDEVDSICNEIEDIERIYTAFFTWPPVFNLDFSEHEDDALAYINYLHGLALKNGEKYRLAIKYLEKSLTYSSKNYQCEVYEHLSESYLQLDNCKQSLKYCKLCLDLNVENENVWLTKSQCLLELDKYQECVDAAETAIELSRDEGVINAANTFIDFALGYSGNYHDLLNRENTFGNLAIMNPSCLDDEEVKKAVSLSYYIRYLALKKIGGSADEKTRMLTKALSVCPYFENTEDAEELRKHFSQIDNPTSSSKNTSSEKSRDSSSRDDTGDDEDAMLNTMLSKLNGGKASSIEDTLKELNSLIGLTAVKEEVAGLVNVVKNRKKREELGLKTPPLSLHMVFSGNPGTGKTTVARIIADIYHNLGLISGGQLIEVDRSKLVAGYVGQTAIQTQAVIDSAIGGILFIDEAYTLSNSKSSNDFGQEAIDTLLKAMEDNRDNLIVIVAGYPDLMKEFLHSNPGLESRFNTTIHFEDYNAAELLELLKFNCNKAGMHMSESAEKYAKAFFEKYCESLPDNFSNGRYVRNLFEKICRNQDNRVAKISNPTKNDFTELTVMDFKGI